MTLLDTLAALLVAIAMAMGDGASSLVSMTHDTHADDGSSRLVMTYTAPHCPHAHDEPCYIVMDMDYEDGLWRIERGP